MMNGYVYYLWGKDETDIFYVGSSIRPKRRLGEHKRDFGYLINMAIVDEIPFDDISDLLRAEIYWIHQLSQWGFNLNNNKYYRDYPFSDTPPFNLHLSIPEFEYILLTQKSYRQKGFKRITLGNTIYEIIKEHKEMKGKIKRTS